MPAILTLGGIAIAVLGALITVAGLPDRAAGLGLGSDLIQAGASLLAGGLIISALGVVLKALRDVADRVEEAGFGLSGPRQSLNDELADETPMPLPRANSRNGAAVQQDDFAETVPAPARDARPPRAPRETPQPAARAQRPAPEAQRSQPRSQRRQEPNFEQPPEDFGDELPPQRQDPQQQPRWMRAQADANNRPQAGVIPLQSNRPGRATPVAPQNPPRREPAPVTYEAEPRRRPAPEPELQETEPAEPTVVRSGIIAGMAYTLYSDGSIEAELPAGTVRFGSLAELQEHVKRAGVDDQDDDYRGPSAAQH